MNDGFHSNVNDGQISIFLFLGFLKMFPRIRKVPEFKMIFEKWRRFLAKSVHRIEIFLCEVCVHEKEFITMCHLKDNPFGWIEVWQKWGHKILFFQKVSKVLLGFDCKLKVNFWCRWLKILTSTKHQDIEINQYNFMMQISTNQMDILPIRCRQNVYIHIEDVQITK